jgi:hypothetical protein
MGSVLKSMFRFSWTMSLFGARQAMSMLMPTAAGRDSGAATAFEKVSEAAQGQLGSGLRAVYQTGDRLQSGVLDTVLAFVEAQKSGREGARRENNQMTTEQGKTPSTRHCVDLTVTTQGPFWPPSEVVDQDGNFILVGGFVLTEVASAKVVPLPNTTGVIVSKDTKPPILDGKEDFSNPFGAPYRIVRELDFGPNGKDWALRLHTLSAGPFVGEFGGGRPRVPALGQGMYNLNANPLWNRAFLPSGHESPQFYRPSYPLDQTPIVRLDEIPKHISIGVRVDNEGIRTSSDDQNSSADFRRSHTITLRDFLAGRGRVFITPLGPSSAFNGARFDFNLEGLLPHSMYGFWALHAASLRSPADPGFILPVPLGIPNLTVTDGRGNASACFELENPFPEPAGDVLGNRLVAVAVIYYSDFQSWGAALSGIATGVNAHTVMSANLSNLPNLFTTRRQH